MHVFIYPPVTDKKLQVIINVVTATPTGVESSCPWTVAEDGSCITFDGKSDEKNLLKWLISLINKYFSPWGHSLSGTFWMDGLHCHVLKNIIQVFEKDGSLRFKWAPNVKGDLLKTLQCVLKTTPTLENYTVRYWNRNSCRVDPIKKVIFIYDKQLLGLSQKFGFRHLVSKIVEKVSRYETKKSIAEAELSLKPLLLDETTENRRELLPSISEMVANRTLPLPRGLSAMGAGAGSVSPIGMMV